MHGNSVVHRRLSYTKTRAKVRNFPHIRSNESENSSIFKANRHKSVQFIPDIWLYRQICILLQHRNVKNNNSMEQNNESKITLHYSRPLSRDSKSFGFSRCSLTSRYQSYSNSLKHPNFFVTIYGLIGKCLLNGST